MNAALLMPSKYLAAVDFRGKDHTLTIDVVRQEELEREDKTKEPKGVVWFKETKKAWILNKTNIKTMIAIFGAETDDWVGKQVTLFPEKNEQSETGVAIRIRGSPHLPADTTFTLKLARKKPRTVKVRKTEARKGTTAAPFHKPAPAPAAAEEQIEDQLEGGEQMENGLDQDGLEPLPDGTPL